MNEMQKGKVNSRKEKKGHNNSSYADNINGCIFDHSPEHQYLPIGVKSPRTLIYLNEFLSLTRLFSFHYKIHVLDKNLTRA